VGGTSRPARTKREADAWLDNAKSEIASGIHSPVSTSITIAAAGEMWIAQAQEDGLERSTSQDKLRLNPRKATCRSPAVHGITIMVNSLFNGWRFEDAWLGQ
jgi:hypothetical protein